MVSLQHGIESVVPQSIPSSNDVRKVVLRLSFPALSWELDRKV
jgi:hypothetical protein